MVSIVDENVSNNINWGLMDMHAVKALNAEGVQQLLIYVLHLHNVRES